MASERAALLVLVVSWALGDEDHFGVSGSLPGGGVSPVLVEGAVLAVFDPVGYVLDGFHWLSVCGVGGVTGIEPTCCPKPGALSLGYTTTLDSVGGPNLPVGRTVFEMWLGSR